MVDIHSHIIPEIDDGSRSMEMTIEMLKLAERCGTKKIIATPHYLMNYGETAISEVKEYVNDINKIIEKEGINLKVYSGQEVFFTEKIVEDYMKGKIGTLNDSRYMLIEFDMRTFDDNAYDYIYELQIRDIVPIIAHPERYRYLIRNPERINKLIDEGYLFQLNSGSIEGRFGSEVKKTAELFLKHDIYNFIGSDAHNTNSSRDADMRKALEIIGEKNIKKFNESAFNILENNRIYFDGKNIRKKRGIFSFFTK
ncbi:MAG: tyrosine-protein phosphatase [Clostridium sp.]